MALRFLKFNTLFEANFVIRGGLIGGIVDRGVAGLIGTTLTFTTPAGAHTFVASITPGVTAGTLPFKEIKSQLEAAIANLVVEIVDSKIGFRHTVLGTNVALAAAASAAKSLLGFKADAAATGKYLNGPTGPIPRAVEMSTSDQAITILIEE